MKYHLSKLLSIALVNTAVCAAPALAQTEPQPPAPEDPPLPTTIPLAPQKSYFGLGAGLGLRGSSSALSSGGLAVFNKLVVSDNISIRNTGVIFGSRSLAMNAALTLDFPTREESSGDIVFSPFIGGGAIIRDDNGTFIDPLVMAGVDLPLPIGVTGLLHLNVAFPRDRSAEWGLLFGVGFQL